ncbi:hypothetical protein [Aminobacter sp. MET-1]|uniref:hypothetical protein n=1 Tax=Aminobacter sp. MET-1 TaxID=2951085 RepID=UPI00226A6AA2|nr:hypothetical protein [Aminobacter sp. MET-1]MCX8571074.1 hypothetical protein [Aminobacter sp. MET-1]MCX8573257.1 hypothetical protein [Aminobacter sp. MET-1]
MVHIAPPDRFCAQWMVYVESMSGAVTATALFDTEAEAKRQANFWHEEMNRTGHVIGMPLREP